MSQMGSYIIKGGGPGVVDTLTGNTGGPVGPDGSDNINIIGTSPISVAGNPGTNTLTIALATPLTVPFGGTGDTSFTVYAPVCGGTSTTAHLQSASTGISNSGYVLTSTGAASLPTWQAAAASGIVTINGDSGSVTGATVTFTGGTSGAVFTGAGATMTESFHFLALPTTTSTNGQIYINSAPYFHAYGAGGTGDRNIFVGFEPGNYTLTGTGNSGFGAAIFGILTTGINNNAIGNAAMGGCTTGSYNQAVGAGALQTLSSGNYNVALGDGALGSLATGSNNTVVGASSGDLYTGAESNNVLISHQGLLGESAVIRIGSPGTQTTCYIAGIDGVNVGSTANVVTEVSNQLGTATITAGTGITVAATANTITISASGSGFSWNNVTGGSATLAAENGYIANAAGLTTFTMPTNNSIGDTIKIVGNGSGGWKIVYGVLQNIIVGSSTSTTTTGNIASTNAHDCVELVCTTASITAPIFTVVSSMGNISVT